MKSGRFVSFMIRSDGHISPAQACDRLSYPSIDSTISLQWLGIIYAVVTAVKTILYSPLVDSRPVNRS